MKRESFTLYLIRDKGKSQHENDLFNATKNNTNHETYTTEYMT